MSEAKRPKLISLDPHKNEGESDEKAVRITILLQEPTEDKCPEFNYKDELLAAKKKSNPTTESKTNGLDPFNDENDDDVKRIAAQMESKYGSSAPKKRKWRKDDYADIGMGYDESDSFIDNTDGYDEIIPRNVTTIHGGFYVNCGALEFKSLEDVSSLDDSSSENEEDDRSEENRKRKIESSSESEDEPKTKLEHLEKKKHLVKKQKLLANSIAFQAMKKRHYGHEKIKQIKKRNDEHKKTARDLLNERRFDRVVISSSENEDKKEEDSNSSLSPAKENKVINSTTSISVDTVIEAIVSESVKKDDVVPSEPIKKNSGIEITPLTTTNVADTVNKELQHQQQLPSQQKLQQHTESKGGTDILVCSLPPNLPIEIISIVEDIKKAAASNTEGKVKFFTDHVNAMLLNLEIKCRILGKHSRGKVYEHLASYVKCKKETLIKRAKNLCIAEDQKKLKTLVLRLKMQVAAVMPDLIKNYEQESSIIIQKRFSQQPDDSNKSLRMPKRSFPWNDESKKIIREIIVLQRKCYIMEGKKDSLELHLLEFVKTDILPIWPEGWMSINTIAKYCSPVVDLKKKPESPKPKVPVTTAQNISNSITTPPIISSNSSLTITPVVPNQKLSSELIITAKNLLKNDEMVITKSPTKINQPSSTSKVEIIKTPPKPIPPNKLVAKHSSNSPDLIVIEESNLSKSTMSRKPSDISENSSSKGLNLTTNNLSKKDYNNSNHFQVIDLTDSNHKKAIHSKPKPPQPQPNKVMPPSQKVKEEITSVSSAVAQIITESLNDNRYVTPNNVSHPNTITTPSVSSSNNDLLKLSNSEYVPSKSSAGNPIFESDDIQQVMENIKALQRLSSPTIKTNNDVSHKNGSGVSVISFNTSSNFGGGNYTSSSQQQSALARSSSFQDAFQNKFIPDFIKASQQTPTMSTSSSSTAKGNSNSIHSYNNRC